MGSTNLSRTWAAVALAAGVTAAPAAHAHISMKGALMSRGGDQKNFPCDGRRGDGPVYTFQPGTTITLSVNEDIPHPSYFRIAFDNEGEDNFVEPKSIKPIDPARACPFDGKDQCGEPDYCNVKSTTGGATVLWDNIDPHLAGLGASYTWTVKLPDVECENCTLQVLQIMEDTVHGAYCPTGSCTDSSLEDIYHRCIDIKLQKGATNSAGVATGAVNVKGMECAPSTAMPTAGTGAGGMGGAGGGAAGGAATGAAGMGATAGMSAVAGSAAQAGASGGAATGATAGAGGTGIGMRMNANTGTAGAPASAGSAAAGAAGMVATTAGTGAGLVAATAGTPAAAGSAAPAGAAAPISGAPAPAAASDDGCSVSSVGQIHRPPAAGLLLLVAAGLIARRRRQRG